MSDSDVPSLNIHVEIVSVDLDEFINGNSSDVPFHAFISSENGSWEVKKTLRDVIRLNKKLKKDSKFRGIDLPLPPDPTKILSSGAVEDGRNQIETKLNEFLHQICHRTVLYTSNLVQKFLKTPKLMRRKSEQLRRSFAIPLHEGFMRCRLDESLPQKKYYCKLYSNYSLAYHEDEASGVPLGVIDLYNANQVFDIPKCERFGIECGSVYMFTCKSVEDKEIWLRCFKKLINNPSTSPFLGELSADKIVTPRTPATPLDGDGDGEDDEDDDVTSPNDFDQSIWPNHEIEENKEIDRVRRLSVDSTNSVASVSRSELKERLQESHQRECCLSDEVKELQQKMDLLTEQSETVRRASVVYQEEHMKLMERCSLYEKEMEEARERASKLESKLESVALEYRENESRWNRTFCEMESENKMLTEKLGQRDEYIRDLLSSHTVVQTGTLGKFQGTAAGNFKYDKMNVKHVTFVSSTKLLMWSMDITSGVSKQCIVSGVSTQDETIARHFQGNRAQRWFKVSTPSRIIVFLANSREDRDEWVNVIQNAIDRKRKTRGPPVSPLPAGQEATDGEGEQSPVHDHRDMNALEPPERPRRGASPSN